VTAGSVAELGATENMSELAALVVGTHSSLPLVFPVTIFMA